VLLLRADPSFATIRAASFGERRFPHVGSENVSQPYDFVHGSRFSAWLDSCALGGIDVDLGNLGRYDRADLHLRNEKGCILLGAFRVLCSHAILVWQDRVPRRRLLPHDPRNDIATAARAFSRLRYVHAFGHVSVRLEDSLLITPTRPPLAIQCATDVIEVNLQGAVTKGDAAVRPIEIFLHIGIYVARKDVRAVCRTHAPYASTWPAEGKLPPIQHGFGGIVGTVATFEACDLIHTADLGAQAAKRLAAGAALLLRGNGVVTVGRTLGEAAARMWSLEERFAQARRQGAYQAPFSANELAARARWYPAETERIWTWLKHLGSSDFAAEATL
jgi:HCOMODA/2-hydroxy-3-carboxy-muconic semialdehyde decarboxylase